MSKALELPDEMKATLRKLQDLSDRVEGGDRGARRELRQALRESSSEIVTQASDIARRGQRMLIQTIARKDPLIKEAFAARLDLMRIKVAGEDPTPLEALLVERIVSLWLLVETLDALVSAQMNIGSKGPRSPMSFLRHVFKWQESAHRR